MYKKIIILILIIFNFIFVFYTNQKSFSIVTTSNINNFYEEISKYKSFNEKEIDKYYNEYLKNNNIIYSLNLVNYPDFLNNNNTYKPFCIFKDSLFVNKNFELKQDYIPKNLVPINLPQIKRKNETMLINQNVLIQANKMFNEASKYNLKPVIYSGYRSYEKQDIIYNTTNDKSYIAKAGTSEHQTGFALDIATLSSGLTDFFMNTKEYLFLKENAHKFGFILRYPDNKEHITKYPSECWHYRYVGTDIATIIYNNNITLEEYIYMYVELNLHQN